MEAEAYRPGPGSILGGPANNGKLAISPYWAGGVWRWGEAAFKSQIEEVGFNTRRHTQPS